MNYVLYPGNLGTTFFDTPPRGSLVFFSDSSIAWDRYDLSLASPRAVYSVNHLGRKHVEKCLLVRLDFSRRSGVARARGFLWTLRIYKGPTMLSFKDMVEMVARLAVSAWVAIVYFVPSLLWAAVEIAFAFLPFIAVWVLVMGESPIAVQQFLFAVAVVLGRLGAYAVALNERHSTYTSGAIVYGPRTVEQVRAAWYGSPIFSGTISLISALVVWYAVKYFTIVLSLVSFALLTLWWRTICVLADRFNNAIGVAVVVIGILGYLALSAVIGNEVWMLAPQTKPGNDYPLWLAWITAPIYIFILAGLGGYIWNADAQAKENEAQS